MKTTAPRPAERIIKRPVFVFDPAGTLVAEYDTVTRCAETLQLGRPCVSAGLQRGSIVASRYYFSYDKTFKAAAFNHAQNPLAPRSQHPRGRSRLGILDREFYEVIN